MAIRIYNNISAHTALRYLDGSQRRLANSIEKLSSGLRINKAGDDPAGLAISEKLRSQIRGVNRASLNTQDGISLLQTAEGALSEVHDMLHRMRELAVQAANDTLTQNDRVEIQREIDQLVDEIDRISTATEFNTKPLLDGSATAIVSVDNPNDMTAIIRGVVREGNYRVSKQNEPGQAQVLKTDIFNIVSSTKNPTGTRGRAIDFGTNTLFQGVGENFRSSDLTDFKNFAFSNSIGGDNNQRGDFQMQLAEVTTASLDQVSIVDHFFQSSGGKSGFTVALAQSSPAIGGPAFSGVGVDDMTAGGVYTGAVPASFEFRISGVGTGGGGVDQFIWRVDGGAWSAAVDMTGAAQAIGPDGLTTTFADDGLVTPHTLGDTWTVGVSSALTTGDSGYYELEISSIYGNNGVIDSTLGSQRLLEITARKLDSEGNVIDTQAFDITHNQALAASDLLGTAMGDMVTAGGINITMGVDSTRWEVGDKLMLVVNAAEDYARGATQYVHQIWQDTGDNGFQADTTGSGVRNDANEDRLGLYTALGTDAGAIDGATFGTSMTFYDPTGNRQTGTGNVRYGQPGYTLNALGGSVDFWMEETTLAERTTLLRDVDKFQGVFGRGGEEITIYNGAGDKSTFVINGTDSMDSMAAKIRKALTTDLNKGGLGMGVDGDLNRQTGVDANVAVFVTEVTQNSDEAVPGTFIIRSTIPGADGRIVFSADQEILDALSIAQIRDPIDPMHITVTDAHSGEWIGSTIIDDGVARNIIPGIDLVIDQRIDTKVEFIPAGEVLAPGDMLEGGSAGLTSHAPADILVGTSSFSPAQFARFQALEPDAGPVGSPLNAIANYEMVTNNAATDQFNVADYSFVNAAAKAGFIIDGAGTLNIQSNRAGYFEMEVVTLNVAGVPSATATLAQVDAAGGLMGLQVRAYDRAGTLLEDAYLQVGATSLGATAAIGNVEYFGGTYPDGGLSTTYGIDTLGGESATVNLGVGAASYDVGDKIVFTVADVNGRVTANLRNDTSDLGFAGVEYDLASNGVPGTADAGISTLAVTSAQVRVGLADNLGANNFNNVAGQNANVSLGFYDASSTFNVGGGSITLGQPGDTIQAGAVQFSLVAEEAAGPGFVFSSAAGSIDEYVHVVDNRVTLQIGANEGQTLTAEIAQLDATALGIDNVLVISRTFAEEALARIDSAVDEVSSQRARLGALINRLEATSRVLTVQSENLLAAESRIRDLDIAYQTVDFTRDQILVQAGTALLAQANALPQSVLQLLQ